MALATKTSHNLQKKDRARSFQQKLLAWYDANKRQLPWRQQTSPYRTLISETMLQQTQVKTVIPYFEQFMKRFPDIQSLAEADENDILTQWSGLGYYRRARQLHQAAKEIRSNYQCRLPADVQNLEKLPGIGGYTARAIASIAFDRPAAVVDGNVKRVMARLFCLEEDVSRTVVAKEIQTLADLLLATKRPGDYNQAIMELGATICTRSSPKCHLCPVSKYCLAQQKGVQATLPIKPKRRKAENFNGVGAIVKDSKGNILIVDDAPKPLKKQGLFEIPVFWNASSLELDQLLQQTYGIKTDTHQEVGKLSHGITHYRMRIHLSLCHLKKQTTATKKLHWLNPKKHQQPISGLCLKALKLLNSST